MTQRRFEEPTATSTQDAGASYCRPYSHSIILSHDKTLIYRRKLFLYTVKHRPFDPSEIHALDFKEEFLRFTICPFSTTIGINRSIFGFVAKTAAIVVT